MVRDQRLASGDNEPGAPPRVRVNTAIADEGVIVGALCRVGAHGLAGEASVARAVFACGGDRTSDEDSLENKGADHDRERRGEKRARHDCADARSRRLSAAQHRSDARAYQTEP